MSTPHPDNEPRKLSFKAPRAKWIRLGIWSVITLLFAFWTHSGWWLLALPLFFDLYITRLLPWGFWRNFKNKTLRTLFDWIDAIVFALVAVYIINIYFFQNYQIPSSSLEKSLLVGDFLFVSKLSYGPRVPMTPLSFPLAQHTLPLVNTKSYLDKPQWGYKRVPGLGPVKRNDIVVFNFPAGDSVLLKVTNPDFYSTRYMTALQNGISLEAATQRLISQSDTYGKLVYRPVDRRENFVKRCIGLPGDTLQIIANQLFIDGKPMEDAPEAQLNYYVQTKGGFLSDRQFRTWNISKEDQIRLPEDSYYAAYLPFKRDANGHLNPMYVLPLTKKVLEQVKKSPFIDTVFVETDTLGGYNVAGPTYPLNPSNTWTRDNYGPIWIPAKGATIELNAHNLMLYGHVISHYEKQTLEVSNGVILINGQPATTYTFTLDYYWMMGDNRHKSADSRAWGFVPEDHIVGKPVLVWLSLDKDRGLFDGKIRWKRLFKKAS